MSSAAYKLVSQHGFEPLGPHGWLHSLKTGQVVLPDPNEQGDEGSILHLFLGVDRPRWPRTIGPVENEGFHPDPSHEALVIWLLENGSDPWKRHEGRNAWSEALYRGWPSVMRHLCARPDAPPSKDLEQELVFQDYCSDLEFRKSDVGMVAPAAFAERDQIDALKVWADLGFSVNLGVGEKRNAGTCARTPDFLAAWVDLEGAITAPTEKGEPLKNAWRFSNAAHQVSMERVWAKHQPADSRPMGERIDEALNIILEGTPKTLATHRFRELGVSVASAREDGVLLRDLWVEKHLESPTKTAPAVAHMLLEQASDEVLFEAVVKGLRSARKSVHQCFPTSRQLGTLLTSGRLGNIPEALHRLADEVVDYPHAMQRLFSHSRELVRRLSPGADRELEKPGVKVKDILEPYWARWFFHPDDPPGQHRGWKAFASWVNSSEGSWISSEFYSSLLSASGRYSEQAAAGVDLLIAAQARKDLKTGPFPSALLEQWETGGTTGWVEGYDLRAPGSVDPSLAAGMWEALLDENKLSSSREAINSLLAFVEEKRMDAQIPDPESTPAPPSRFRF